MNITACNIGMTISVFNTCMNVIASHTYMNITIPNTSMNIKPSNICMDIVNKICMNITASNLFMSTCYKLNRAKSPQTLTKTECWEGSLNFKNKKLDIDMSEYAIYRRC